MQIYVCIKHVPDSAANITIRDKNDQNNHGQDNNGQDNYGIGENIAFLLNPFDEHAVTEAAALKKEYKESEIIAVCLGKKDAEKTIRSAMAMGADRGILIHTPGVHDSITTARALKAAIEQDGIPDIIFTGKESIDAEGMQTMFRLGALFNFPVVTNVLSVKTGSGRAIVEYDLGAGKTRTCDLELPCVIAAGRGLNTPAYPTFPDVVKARKKSVHLVDFKDLSYEQPLGSASIVGLEPLVQQRSPKEIKGSPEEIASTLVFILKNEAKVIS
ncbi:MAG: electron transfer flavoprotein subunit beta/FixA family protein [Desulfobacula sp.]|nr:electron transfer flavoprotein subunit beta/FixA family protein [Desulfobacula sp.]